MNQDRNESRKPFVCPHISIPSLTCFARDTASTITQGRVICRLVSMFQSIEELVQENDRRSFLQLHIDDDDDDSDSEDHTLEYVHPCLSTLRSSLQTGR